MKKAFIILSIILTTFYIKAQNDTVFNYNYPLEWQHDCSTMLMHNGNYYFSGGIARTNEACEFWIFGYHISKINETGTKDTTVIFDKCGHTTYIGWEGSSTFIGDTLITFGMSYNENNEHKMFVLQSSPDLDTIRTNYYFEDTTTKRSFSCCITNDNNLILCGQVDSTRDENSGTPEITHTKGYLLKTRLNGETIWSKSYAFGDESDGCWSLFAKVIPTYDNGFIVTGRTSDFGNSKNLILKTDSLGNEEWVRFFNSYSAYDTPAFQDIIETKDSCYIACGAYSYGETFGGLYPYDGWLIKIDSDGNTIWNKKYREHRLNPGDSRDSIYCQFFSVCEQENGQLAITGIARKEEGYSNRTPFVYFLNENGDTVKTNYYFQYEVGHPDYVNISYPKSIKTTDDGGLAIGGWAEYIEYNEENEQWLNPQRIFLIKTDSLGNDTTINNILPYQTKPITNFTLNCYPNPATYKTYVEIPQMVKDDILLIYSTNGTIVHEQTVVPGENRINLCGLKPGMYLLKLRDMGLFGKITIQ